MRGYIRTNKFLMILLGSIIYFSQAGFAQASSNTAKDDKAIQFENLIRTKQFVFVAQTATPLSGRFINLTSVYDVRLLNDTIVSELPYFGRAFTAPMNPSEGPLNFTSTKFSYSSSARKKGGWDITIKPQDTKDVRQLFFTVSEKGYASLQVTSNNRQPINFSGYVTSREKFK